MLIVSQFLLWVVAALLFIAVAALSRQLSGLRQRLDQGSVCVRCSQAHDAAAAAAAQPHGEPTSFA